MRFTCTLELGGKTATGLPVPDDVVAGLGSHRRPPVTVTINGFSYRSTVSTMGGRFMVPVSAEVRRNAGVEAGDELTVDIELDDGPREVTVPDDLAAALAAEPSARAAFDALTYTQRKEHARSVESAKAPETRTRRITKIVDTLRGV